MSIALAAFALALLAYLAIDLARAFLRARSKKVGGLTFVAIGRLKFSYCIAKKAPATSRAAATRLARISSAR